MKFNFVKDPDGRWYIDLPNFIEEGGDRESLEMVAGADFMLDKLSGSNASGLSTDIEEFKFRSQIPHMEDSYDGILTLEHLATDDVLDGCFYKAYLPKLGMSFEVWLCAVTMYVFGEYPKIITINKLANEPGEN